MTRLPVFFVLVFALSLPLWVIGGATDQQLMPGLSVSALMSFCPMFAAMVLVYRDGGAPATRALLGRCVDVGRITSIRWLLPVLLLMPAVSGVVYGLMRWMSMPVPAAEWNVAYALLLFIAFFLGALGEELGWSGYAIDPLQARWGALRASLVVGAVGVVWHLPALLLSHRVWPWIGWWFLYAFAARILTVWLYNNTGKSVCAAALFHATLNLAYMLFPVYGSHFDMRLGGGVMAVAACVVVAVWGHSTLAGRMNPRVVVALILMGLVALGLAAFGAVIARQIARLDSAALWLIRRNIPAEFNEFSTLVSATGGALFLVPATVALTAIFLILKQRREAVLVASAMACAGIATYAIKAFANRPRPELWAATWYSSSSFPSGHTLCTTAFATVLVVCLPFVWPGSRRPALALSVLWVTLVALSRLVLGAHWPSDVVAAICIGLFIVLAQRRLVDHQWRRQG